MTSWGAQVIVERSCFGGGNNLGSGGSPVLLGRAENGTPPRFQAMDNFVDVVVDNNDTASCGNLVSEMEPDGSPPTCSNNANATTTSAATECLSTVRDVLILW